LTTTAYALHDALGLQRARVRALVLRAEDLTDAARTARQLSLDPADERRRRAGPQLTASAAASAPRGPPRRPDR
jgi:hypothetical protein